MSGWLGAAAGLALGAAGLLATWGFSVDDALISARVAANLNAGFGYRFNPHGDIVDAVTPLGFAYLLRLSLANDPLEVFQWARVAGAAIWLSMWGWLGALTQRRFGARALVWLLVCTLNPCGPAWASSGMETPWIAALMLLGLGSYREETFGGQRAGARGSASRWRTSGPLCLGLAAALRPELLPCCGVLLVGWALPERGWRRLLPLGLGVLPTLVVVGIRLHVFGLPMPLSALAKPSDLSHGFRYALGGWLLCGAPILATAPVSVLRGWSGLTRRARIGLLALLAHAAALTLAGGDWMALYRLYVPVLPLGVLVAAELGNQHHLSEVVDRWRRVGAGLRMAVALLGAAVLWRFVGLPATHVVADRLSLIASARPHLKGMRVASVDIGWVGAAGADVVIDLAGVTDPSVAVLAGGHTSKRLDPNFLERRHAQRLVVLCEPGAKGVGAERSVEQRILKETKNLEATLSAQLPVGMSRLTYCVFYFK